MKRLLLPLLAGSLLLGCQNAAPPQTGTPSSSPMPAQTSSPVAPGMSPSPTEPSASPTGRPNPSPSASATLNPAASGNTTVTLPDGSRLLLSLDNRFLSAAGQSTQIRASLTNAAGQPIPLGDLKLLFGSSRPEDISVDASGLIRALRDNGFSEITVRVEGTDLSTTQLVSVAGSSGSKGGGGGSSNATQSDPGISRVSPASARGGEAIVISGLGFDGATAVLVNGMPASFTIDSDRRITATLPFGALSSGTVTVVTPEGTYDSDAPLTITGRVWLVDADAVGTDDGASWVNAEPSLFDALAASTSGDQIWVAAGTYLPVSDGTSLPAARESTFLLKSGVSVYGGFAGSESELDARDPEANLTILSGDIDGAADSYDFSGDALGTSNTGGNAYHVVTGAAGDSEATRPLLDGFRIEGGNADGDTDGNEVPGTGIGGGMLNLNLGSFAPRLRQINFYANQANPYGGGLYSAQSELMLEKVSFAFNYASFGGGLYNHDGNLRLSDVAFDHNAVSYNNGGGMYERDASSSYDQVRFTDNLSPNYGAGLFLEGLSNPVMTRMRFSRNRLTGSGRDGGAIALFGLHDLRITEATFEDNYAEDHGSMIAIEQNSGPAGRQHIVLDQISATGNEAGNDGGIYMCCDGDDELIVTNSRFSGNEGSDGAAILSAGQLTLEDDVFDANSPGYHGVVNNQGFLDANRVVFANNTGGPDGSALYTYGARVRNSVFAGNVGGTDIDLTWGSAVFVASGNVELINNTFYNNTLSNGTAGDIYRESGTLALVNNLFVNGGLFNTPAFVPGDGNHNAVAAPFVNAPDPAGCDGIWLTSDDGLRLATGSSAIDVGVSSFTGIAIPDRDALNKRRSGSFEPGAYEGAFTSSSCN